MNDYRKFGYYFDDIMTQIDYNDWLEFTKEYLNDNYKILDLACGSGTLVNLLTIEGYEADGLDLSVSMIDVAREKARMQHISPNYYQMDMTSFKLDKKYNIITCYFDSINHLPSFEMVEQTFDRVYEHLDRNGLFIFDIFSLAAFKEAPGSLENECMSCEYKWDIEIQNEITLHHRLTIFDDDVEINENYYEYYYDITKLIDNPKFNLLRISGDFTDKYDNNSGRLLVVMQKKNENDI